MDYNSDYEGQEVADLLDKAKILNVTAVDTSETIDDASGSPYVKYVAQTLTEAQKEQARKNIGLDGSGGTVDVDLSDYYTKNEIDSKGFATASQLSSKQDKIEDLDTIRSGAARGATALQSYTEKYTGTVSGVKINGTTKSPANGIVDLGTVITAHQSLAGYATESYVQAQISEAITATINASY